MRIRLRTYLDDGVIRDLDVPEYANVGTLIDVYADRVLQEHPVVRLGGRLVGREADLHAEDFITITPRGLAAASMAARQLSRSAFSVKRPHRGRRRKLNVAGKDPIREVLAIVERASSQIPEPIRREMIEEMTKELEVNRRPIPTSSS